MAESSNDREELLTGGGRTPVTRKGQVVYRKAGPWSATVHGLLRHLEQIGFAGSPRVVGSGFAPDGREMVSYIDGASVHPGPWNDEELFTIGRLLSDLHRATASFRIPDSATWRPWHGRDIGDGKPCIGHGDSGPWNIMALDGEPHALIDWEVAGPVDPLVELAQCAWLNAQLMTTTLLRRSDWRRSVGAHATCAASWMDTGCRARNARDSSSA